MLLGNDSFLTASGFVYTIGCLSFVISKNSKYFNYETPHEKFRNNGYIVCPYCGAFLRWPGMEDENEN